MDDAERQEFWRARHRETDRYWLTGSSAAEYAALYELRLDDAPAGTAVTEIGVGTGRATHELAARGYAVSAVDLVDEALARVADCARVHRVDDLEHVQPAVLALCHLVVQHVETPMVERLLRVPLVPDCGILCVQSAWLEAEDPAGLTPDLPGLVWHPAEEMAVLFDRAGLVVHWERRLRLPIKDTVVGWGLWKATRRA